MLIANLASICTLCNLTCGFLAMVSYLMGHPVWALALLVVGFFLDGLDGALARRTNSASAFGERLDSLSDLTTFGMAPAFMALRSPHHLEWEPSLMAVVAMFLVCGAIRLARYDPKEQKYRFSGMPIPMAGLLLAAFSQTSDHVPWFHAAPAVLGLLMVSDVPFMKVSFVGRRMLLPLILGAFSLSVLALNPRHDLAVAMLGFTVPYLVLNLFLALLRDVRGRLRTAAEARAARATR